MRQRFTMIRNSGWPTLATRTDWQTWSTRTEICWKLCRSSQETSITLYIQRIQRISIVLEKQPRVTDFSWQRDLTSRAMVSSLRASSPSPARNRRISLPPLTQTWGSLRWSEIWIGTSKISPRNFWSLLAPWDQSTPDNHPTLTQLVLTENRWYLDYHPSSTPRSVTSLRNSRNSGSRPSSRKQLPRSSGNNQQLLMKKLKHRFRIITRNSIISTTSLKSGRRHRPSPTRLHLLSKTIISERAILGMLSPRSSGAKQTRNHRG